MAHGHLPGATGRCSGTALLLHGDTDRAPPPFAWARPADWSLPAARAKRAGQKRIMPTPMATASPFALLFWTCVRLVTWLWMRLCSARRLVQVCALYIMGRPSGIGETERATTASGCFAQAEIEVNAMNAGMTIFIFNYPYCLGYMAPARPRPRMVLKIGQSWFRTPRSCGVDGHRSVFGCRHEICPAPHCPIHRPADAPPSWRGLTLQSSNGLL